jgi:hypothetical protein
MIPPSPLLPPLEFRFSELLYEWACCSMGTWGTTISGMKTSSSSPSKRFNRHHTCAMVELTARSNFFQSSRRNLSPLLYIRALIARPGPSDSESLPSIFLGESAARSTHMRPSLAPTFYSCSFSRNVSVLDSSLSQAKWIYFPDRGARRVVASG